MRTVVFALLVIGNCLHAQAPRATEERAGFVTTLGRDTVALESFTRTNTRLDGDIVIRIPGTVRIHYAIELTGRGIANSVMELTPFDVASVAPRRIALTVRGDSAELVIDSAGVHRKQMVSAGELSPVLMTGFGASYGLYSSLGMYELLFSRSSVRGSGTTAREPTISISSGVSQYQLLRSNDRSAVDVDYFGMGWTHVALGERGEIVSVDARETTEQTRSRRTEAMDIERLVKDFAEKDRSGQRLGMASPNEIVRTSVGSAAAVISFGSPRTRGREILGAVVPYDKVWRTGANAASVLKIDHDVTIGGTKVPAGSYSLWTLPTANGATLIINSAHGQWGTDYDASKDFARIPMTVTTSETPLEKFSIGILAGTNGGQVLRIMWDHFEWSVPIAS
ncbi:MAG: DUF2911 domain-containing protein [bacterium]